MSAHKVSLVSSFNAPYCGGKGPEVIRYLVGDYHSDSSVSIFASFDLVLSIVNSANGEEPSLCESVPVQGADF